MSTLEMDVFLLWKWICAKNAISKLHHCIFNWLHLDVILQKLDWKIGSFVANGKVFVFIFYFVDDDVIGFLENVHCRSTV